VTDHAASTAAGDYPPNVEFPWNDLIDMTGGGSEQRPVIVALNAIHDQLCVVADLLRAQVAS
jgi:hypothetical protein